MNGEGTVVVFSDAGFAKQTPLGEYEPQGRSGKGLKTFLWTKGAANGTRIVAAFCLTSPAELRAVTKSSKGQQKVPAMLGDAVTQVVIV